MSSQVYDTKVYVTFVNYNKISYHFSMTVIGATFQINLIMADVRHIQENTRELAALHTSALISPNLSRGMIKHHSPARNGENLYADSTSS